MSRNLYVGLFVVVVAGAALLYIYKTPSLAQPTAEFGGVSLKLEYATTEAEKGRGLSGRENIPGDYGMLFVFPKDDYYGFWMNDMLVSIDIFWLNSKGQVVSIEENVAPSSYPDVFYPTEPARYVLETIAGFAREHSIEIGTPLLLKNFPNVTK